MPYRRVAILGGFGLSLGDGVIGLQALSVAQSVCHFPKPCLFRWQGLGIVDGVYQLASDLADIQALEPDWPPIEAHDLKNNFDQVIDMRDFALNPGFRGVSMIDFFLDKLRVDKERVPSAMKQNDWLARRANPIRPTNLPLDYVLFCPDSSMHLRSIPDKVANKMILYLQEFQTHQIVSQRKHSLPNVTIAERCHSINDLCGLIRHAKAVISTDTAIVHLAAAWSVPCLALFTTHNPEWRVRDYPFCTAIYWPISKLPTALEFSRGPDDIEAAEQNWATRAPLMSKVFADFFVKLQ